MDLYSGPYMNTKPGPMGIPLKEIERRLDAGMTPREIAMTLGCSVQNVYERTREYRKRNAPAAANDGGAPTGASRSRSA